MSKKQGLRLYDYLENKRYGVSGQSIEDELEISPATFKRALRYLREQGITVFSPQNGGYKLDERSRGKVNLSGELLNEDQLGLLLESVHTLTYLVQADVFKEQLAPVLNRIKASLHKADQPPIIDVIHHHARKDTSNHLKTLLNAAQLKKQIDVHYSARTSGHSTRRVSIQKLIYYRANWYLIAWCHQKKSIRTFAVERFEHIDVTSQCSFLLEEEEITAFYRNTYGIFGGRKVDTARLRFSADVAQWIQDELWHPDQQLQIQQDGSVILEIPIGETLTELVMDLMKYGEDLEVLHPEKLKKALIVKHRAAQKMIGSQNEPSPD